jgi:hypothetical protein
MSQQPIEYRQLYSRLYAQRVRGGKLFTDRAAASLQEGHYREALQDLAIARSFFPENEKLTQLMRLIKSKHAQSKQGRQRPGRPQNGPQAGQQRKRPSAQRTGAHRGGAQRAGAAPRLNIAPQAKAAGPRKPTHETQQGHGLPQPGLPQPARRPRATPGAMEAMPPLPDFSGRDGHDPS